MSKLKYEKDTDGGNKSGGLSAVYCWMKTTYSTTRVK